MLAGLSQDRETTVSRRRRRLDMLKTTTLIDTMKLEAEDVRGSR
jgi:hypothetical protein